MEDNIRRVLELIAINEPVYDEWSCLWCGAERPRDHESYPYWDGPRSAIPHASDCPYKQVLDLLSEVKDSHPAPAPK
jgi:hypothetical protein